MCRLAFKFTLLFAINLMTTSHVHADQIERACNILEDAEDDIVTVSVKYSNRSVRDQVWRELQNGMHLDFMSRMVADINAEKALRLCEHPGVDDIEIIAWSEKKTTLHRLFEVRRIYNYALGGRYDISAFNFSQGVRTEAIGKNISGERTMAEALDAIARRAAPVFVAVGNAGSIGLSGFSEGRYVLPVAASQDSGKGLYSKSSRPDETTDPKRLFLFSDGAPRSQQSAIDMLPGNSDTSQHLTIGQMLLPEESQIKVGGSSFAAFAATSTACLVQQYLEVANSYLSATKSIGRAQLNPFIALYIDNPVPEDSEGLKHRLADKREKFVPIYNLSIAQKERIQNFFFGNSLQMNMRYSTSLLTAFYKSMPSTEFVKGFQGPQRYVSQSSVLNKLRSMTMGDWVKLAANSSSLYYPRWLDEAAKDTAPMIDGATVDRIGEYCRSGSLFVVLSDQAAGEF